MVWGFFFVVVFAYGFGVNETLLQPLEFPLPHGHTKLKQYISLEY